MKSKFTTLRERIKAPTPNWFKGIMKLSISLAAAGSAVLASEASVPKFHLPTTIETVAQWFVVAGVVAAAVAKTSSTKH